jgi:hypothetical protein
MDDAIKLEPAFVVEVTMPSGEKLEPIRVDRDAFTLSRADEVGYAIGRLVGKLVDKRLKA